MPNEEKKLKRFGALTRKKAIDGECYVTRVIFAESKEAAEKYFGENNYEILGNVYAKGQ